MHSIEDNVEDEIMELILQLEALVADAPDTVSTTED